MNELTGVLTFLVLFLGFLLKRATNHIKMLNDLLNAFDRELKRLQNNETTKK